jgi:hypothetical protein
LNGLRLYCEIHGDGSRFSMRKVHLILPHGGLVSIEMFSLVSAGALGIAPGHRCKSAGPWTHR